MDLRKCRNSAFAALLLLARLSTSMVIERQDANLTALSNPDAIKVVNELQYSANCTSATTWHNNLPLDVTNQIIIGAGNGSDPINIAFLRSCLPVEYQNSSDAALTEFYNYMSTGSLKSLDWLGTAIDDVETVCITPKYEKELPLSQLNVTQNCTATAEFLSGLGFLNGPEYYNSSISANDSSWLDFIYYALPPDLQNNITDVELDVFYDHISTSFSDAEIGTFLNNSYQKCSDELCAVQGYTGNPDIGGIGVLASYTTEAILVTLYFFAVNAEIYIYGLHPLPNKIPSRWLKAFRRASDDLLDGALFFSLSISSAGWVSFHSGKSYYEKLVFTSANVLALSALFGFIAMFPDQYHRKRGHVLFLLIGSILVESSFQYVAYLIENSKTKYSDYDCLHDKFDGRYHPAFFESLFFLLVGLSVVGGGGYLWYRLKNRGKVREWKTQHGPVSGTELIVFRARLVLQVVTIMVVWAECIYLFKIRNIMAEVAGSSWSEGAWGFGQILALFVWAPPVLTAVATLVLPRAWTGKEDPDDEGDEGEKDEKTGFLDPPYPLVNLHQRIVDPHDKISPTVPEKVTPITTTSVATGVER